MSVDKGFLKAIFMQNGRKMLIRGEYKVRAFKEPNQNLMKVKSLSIQIKVL